MREVSSLLSQVFACQLWAVLIHNETGAKDLKEIKRLNLAIGIAFLMSLRIVYK